MKRMAAFWKGFLILLAAILILAVAIGWCKLRPSRQETNASTAANIRCLESPAYFVIDNNPGLPGLDIIAKQKTSADETIPCVDAASAADFVIQNNLPEQVIGLTENFLIVDSGTAPPPRGLEIYNLNLRTSTYSDTYSPPISIATGTVTYWESTEQTVTQKNCPDLDQYTADGLGAVMESHITLALSTLAKTQLGEFRCEPTQ